LLRLGARHRVDGINHSYNRDHCDHGHRLDGREGHCNCLKKHPRRSFRGFVEYFGTKDHLGSEIM
jgi:hypothetical protein